MLGYDVGAAEVERIVADLHGACADLPACDPALRPASDRLLEMFADVRALSRPRHDEADPETPWLRSPQEHLNAWLGSLDAEAEGAARRFVALLRAALAHYGIDDLDRTPALEEACYRLYLAQERAETARAAVVAILDRRLERAAQLAGQLGDGFREALDRLVAATDGARRRSWPTSPARCATATSTSPSSPPPASASTPRWRRTSPRSPRTRRARIATSASRRSSRARGRSPPCSPRACAAPRRPCGACSSRRWRGATTACARSRASSSRGSAAASCSWRSTPSEGRRRHLAAAYVDLDDVGALASAFARHAAHAARRRSGRARPLRRASAARRRRATSWPRRCATALAAVPLPPALQRIVVAVAEPERGRGMSAIDTFTFRHQPEGLVEDEVVRGLHPMMGHRLALWRLENFALERLASPEDVYAFRGVGARERQGRAAVRARRGARPHAGPRRGGADRRAARAGAHPRRRRSRPSAGFQAAPRARQAACSGTGSSSTSGRSMDLSPEEINAVMQRLAPDHRRPRDRARARRRAPARARRRRLRERVLRFFTLVGEGVVVEVGDPSTEPLQPLDEGARRIVAARRRGVLHPAEIVRLLAPARATRPAIRPAPSSSTTSTTTASSSPSTGRPATNAAGIVVGTIRNVTDAPSGGDGRA